MNKNKILGAAKFYFYFALIFTTVFVIYFLGSTTSNFYEDLHSLTKKDFSTLHVSTCGRFPTAEHIFSISTYWHILKSSNTLYLLYRAYYDDRISFNAESLKLVRVLLYANNPNVTERIFCQLWYEGHDDPIVSKVSEMQVLWVWSQNTKGYSPYLMSCPNPLEKIPKFVSVVENHCDDANNRLEVLYKPPKEQKKDFIVCTKDLDYKNDISTNLIEWLEILKILGADKVIIYVLKVHQNTMRVLKFYESEGFLEVVKLEHPTMVIDANNTLQFIQSQLISLQDCFYRHYNEYHFAVPIDTDEFPVPTNPNDHTWQDLLQRVSLRFRNDYDPFHDAYESRNVYFIYMDEYHKKLHPDLRTHHFLDNTLRFYNHSPPGTGTKSFMSTLSVYIVHNHYPLMCLRSNQILNCHDYHIEIEDAQLSHYRYTCDGNPESKSCIDVNLKTAFNDTTLLKYKDEIKKGVGETEEKLKDFEFDVFDEYFTKLRKGEIKV